MNKHTMEEQHRRLADESRWVKWLLEGLAWLTVVSGTFATAFYIYEGATAPNYEGGGMYFSIASMVVASSLISFLLWKLLAIAVGSVSLKHRRLAQQPMTQLPVDHRDSTEVMLDETMVG